MNCSCRPAVADFQFFKLCKYEFTLRKLEKFPIYQMKTGNFGLRYIWKISGLRNGNSKFYGLC